MEQPEIVFVKKLIRIRCHAQRIHANRKPGVMDTALWLDRHIKANGYATPEQAQGFLLRHRDKVDYLIPSGKYKLKHELFKLLNG